MEWILSIVELSIPSFPTVIKAFKTPHLLVNYPNPFNPETWIPFQLSQDAEVRLTAGSYSQTEKAIYWDGQTETGEQVSSGTYFYQLQAGDYTETRKMVILK